MGTGQSQRFKKMEQLNFKHEGESPLGTMLKYILRDNKPFALFRYADYRQLAVYIFCDVGGEELYQVEALFGLQASLLQDGGDSLHTRVAGFREMLFRICGVDTQAEPPKPPLKVSAQWSRMCAASVGKSTERNVSNKDQTYLVTLLIMQNKCLLMHSEFF